MAETAEAERAWPHSSLGDHLDLEGRHALNVHLGQRRHQRLIGALIAFEELGREPAVPILLHPQLELAHPGDERAGVVAGSVAEPGGRALALLGPERVGHFRFQHLLHHRANDLAQPIRALCEKLVDGGHGRLVMFKSPDSLVRNAAMTKSEAKPAIVRSMTAFAELDAQNRGGSVLKVLQNR
jgi:hypothetical protein